jgi:hypothetical protein
MSDDLNLQALSIRGLPSAIANNTRGPLRSSRYGELVNMPVSEFRKVLAEQGSYFVAHNATNDAATTIAGHTAPVLADADVTMTKPLIHCVNNVAGTSLVRCILDFIEIEVVTAGATGTQACWATQLDTGATRITTPGTALTTVNPNMQSSTAANLAPTAGAIVVSAESANVRHLGHGTIRPSIEIAGDIKSFVFGGDPAAIGQQPGQAATAIRTSTINLPPVILGPTDFFLLALHSQASQNAAGVYKIRMGWWEL